MEWERKRYERQAKERRLLLVNGKVTIDGEYFRRSGPSPFLRLPSSFPLISPSCALVFLILSPSILPTFLLDILQFSDD